VARTGWAAIPAQLRADSPRGLSAMKGVNGRSSLGRPFAFGRLAFLQQRPRPSSLPPRSRQERFKRLAASAAFVERRVSAGIPAVQGAYLAVRGVGHGDLSGRGRVPHKDVSGANFLHRGESNCRGPSATAGRCRFEMPADDSRAVQGVRTRQRGANAWQRASPAAPDRLAAVRPPPPCSSAGAAGSRRPGRC